MLKYIGEFEKLKDYGFEREDGIIIKDNGTYNWCSNLYIDEKSRRISVFGNVWDDHLEKLYDLIKDGLVEKVDE